MNNNTLDTSVQRTRLVTTSKQSECLTLGYKLKKVITSDLKSSPQDYYEVNPA